ncbi:hypothetical protein ACIBVL_31585 [Streptomyces sp. NPDC049687]|uniref:hypothetical protein n=1 Tax=Streptomyces sp. NPDC049687 TaxID=3365596 RepID=UPI00378FA5BC
MTDNQHKADLERVSHQNSFTDFARGVEERPGGGFFRNTVRAAIDATPVGQALRQRTNFESHGLNEMLDLVEQTNPEDLESSGNALWAARDAIEAAATELDGHIENVHWVGESGDAFRKWGRSLVTTTKGLSDFAGSAGDQIMAAATGLASVRKAMPARDTRTDPTPVRDIPKVERVASNDAYTAAVEVEKNRQEAINQMNRLSSYYTVSEEQLAALKAPEFTVMPDVGVPAPITVPTPGPGEVASGGTHETAARVVTSPHASVHVSGHSTSGATTQPTDVAGHITQPDRPVGTNIDSVGTLPTPSPAPVTGSTPPVTGTPGPGGGHPGAFGGGFPPPVSNGMSGRASGGSGGVRSPVSAQGRASSGLGNSAPARAVGRGVTNQMGHAGAPGQTTAKGSASGARPSPMGRGVTGGTPRSTGGTMPRANGAPVTGAGRANGVVGGRPTTSAGPSANGGTRMPRGTVVGAEGAPSSRSTAGTPGQRGVFGAPESTGRTGSSLPSTRGGAGTSEAVTGRPATHNSVARAERNGMTRGGAGLVRGPANRQNPADGQNVQGTPRPDYLVEDEETHLPTKPRRDVPPVIN